MVDALSSNCGCAPQKVLPCGFFLFRPLSLSLHRAVLVAGALQSQYDLKPSLLQVGRAGSVIVTHVTARRGTQDRALAQLLPCTLTSLEAAVTF